MLTERFDPIEAERLEQAFWDEQARGRTWDDHDMGAPTDDLAIFFDNLSGERVLDVGCGWGYYVYEFLDQELDYHGIDLSPEMIAAARERNPDASFAVQSYRDLPFPDDCFDGLWCCCVFGGEPKHNMPQVLAELRRVLQPSGVITVIMPSGRGSVDELAHDPTGTPIGWDAGYTPLELHRLLVEAQFTDVTSFDRQHLGAHTVTARK